MIIINLFDIVPQREVVNKQAILDKISKSKNEIPSHKASGPSILNLIQTVKENMDKYMGDKKEDYLLVTDTITFVAYCDKIIENGIYSIDTETTGLDPMLDDIVGFSLYTPGMKAMYSPVSHISYVTKQPLDNQLPKHIVTEQFQRIVNSNAKAIFANAQFDIRFIRHFFNVNIIAYYDCLLASKILNENEQSNALKPLYKKYVLKNQEDAFKFGELFNGVKFNLVPPNVGYLYAARDAEVTYQLYEFQIPFLTPSHPYCQKQKLEEASKVFWDIEMPTVQVVCNMEDTGVDIDLNKQQELSTKYNALLKERESECYRMLQEYQDLIDRYIAVTPDPKIDNPINLGSPTQLSILLYDILKIPPPNKKKPRSTEAPELKKIDHPLCKQILGYREFAKLVSTYIDKLPNCLNPNDHRIHCEFKQYGACTGRFSSENPNLQNIPSHNKEIRQMFKATDGYVLMSSDFSQQEPKCLAALCAKAGDPQMLNTFLAGKDLYSEIAAVSFNTTYEECLEHFPKGSYIKQIDNHWYYATENDYDKIADGENDTYADGKSRRSQAKSILLGRQLKCPIAQ